MGGAGAKKDIRKIAKQTKKLGKKIADKGTYETWMSGREKTKVSFEYNGNKFLATFSNTPSSSGAFKVAKDQIKKSLKEIGFTHTPDFLRLEPTLTAAEREIQEIVEELYRLLDEEDDE